LPAEWRCPTIWGTVADISLDCSVGVALLAVESTYFLAPNVKRRFLATLPGGVLAVLCWLSFSCLLGFYFCHIVNFSRTYGTLEGFTAFLTWFYWNSFALLVGAELNAELAKESARDRCRRRTRRRRWIASACRMNQLSVGTNRSRIVFKTWCGSGHRPRRLPVGRGPR
jgi:uncharacterized BrkB/YihY/UPF0761 family membrane protein